MLRKVSSTTIWVTIFLLLVAVQAYSAFGQSSDIVGLWKNGSVGMIQYQNRTTGTTKPGRGSIFTYKFNPNGTYEFVGYMEITMYNCTTTLFNSIVGRYTVNDSTINLNPSKDFWKNTNSCAASGNKQQNKVPTKLTIYYQRKQDDYGKELLCLTEKEGETCYRKEE
ncbi:MAG: hypothetical protein ABIR33_03920 [Pyrinomonadaceae bacterium]